MGEVPPGDDDHGADYGDDEEDDDDDDDTYDGNEEEADDDDELDPLNWIRVLHPLVNQLCRLAPPTFKGPTFHW